MKNLLTSKEENQKMVENVGRKIVNKKVVNRKIVNEKPPNPVEI